MYVHRTFVSVLCFAGRAFPHPVGFWMFDKQFEGKDLSGESCDNATNIRLYSVKNVDRFVVFSILLSRK